jgi:hypothetical protein
MHAQASRHENILETGVGTEDFNLESPVEEAPATN